MDHKEITDLLEKNYRILNESNAKWLDKRVKYLLARIFTGKGQILPLTEFDWLDKAFIHKSGLFTSFSKVTRYTLTGLMLSSQLNSVEGIEELFFNKKILKDNGFKSSGATYFAAYQLFLSKNEDREAIVQRADRLYKEIKAIHPFITTTNDYSAVVSLAQAEQLAHLSEVEICGIVEYYFEEFQAIGLKNRDSCLVASTLSTLMNGKKDLEYLSHLSTLIEFFENNRIKIKSVHFVPLVSLTYLRQQTDLVDLEELLIFMDEVCKNISIYFEADYKESLAMSLYAESKSNTLNRSNMTTLSVSFNQIIVQEQTMLASNSVALIN
ncbi:MULTISPECIES: DUF4003 family protein [Vagococcus]|uniref:Alternate gene name: ydjQ n=1 Tax=Vagococcus fluvialis bH819 TaxID=1255619 RepID=A0A1X6WLS0_9ENTE|nr:MULTISPECIES: DUF4003 family protein [Vagococcus]SLM84616.1 alternate gene name: ydjQ [Vagococcus fluvialis bH819]HCM89920.1 DUF4003 domain-containing protein [Vagococcus sp.]